MDLTLKELYYEVKNKIDKVDFNMIWKGFKPMKFALYNSCECFFDGEYIEKSDSFLANTAINYKGEVIAIWNVMEEVDTVILASKIIHEMFHGFQMINQELRFPDELDALYNYLYDDTNLSIKLEENKLLVELVDEFSLDKFNTFLKYRKYRFNHKTFEYNYEAMVEQIEGSANYVELMALKELSKDLFIRKLDSIKSNIVNKKSFLPIRVLCYDIGALLIYLLKENNIPFFDGFCDKPFSVLLLGDTQEAYIDVSSFKDEINGYYKRVEDVINNAINKNDVVIESECDILGVNFYNAVYYKGYIISIFFVMFKDGDNQRIEYGNFVIETKEKKKLTKIYRY